MKMFSHNLNISFPEMYFYDKKCRQTISLLYCDQHGEPLVGVRKCALIFLVRIFEICRRKTALATVDCLFHVLSKWIRL